MASVQSRLDDPIIIEFVKAVRKKLGSRLQRVILFGSHARGDSWEGSDYDFAVIIDNHDRDVDEYVLDAITEILDCYDALVSAQVFGEEEWFVERNFPLGINIIREGVAL